MNLFARARVAALGTARRISLQQMPPWLLALLALSACSAAPDIVARELPPGEVYDPTRPPKVLDVSGDTEVHDPTISEFEGRFYLFQTGSGILTKTSSDLLTWQTGPTVFSENPAWIADSVPGVGALWSPAVATFGGRAHLYYAASTFGDDRSCIGHASKSSLASDEAWTDQGSIVCSNTGNTDDDWNAIDPGILFAEGAPWLVFGSYLSGIKLVRLDSAGGQRDGTELHSLATRTGSSKAIQQPFLLARGGYYYLFSSFDGCCMGVNSTHKIMVGRSTELLGPYVDREGTALLEGGGTLVLEGDDRFKGPGSNAVLFHEHKSYNVYHAYDANQSGPSLLRIAELVWDDAGWPISGGP